MLGDTELADFDGRDSTPEEVARMVEERAQAEAQKMRDKLAPVEPEPAAPAATQEIEISGDEWGTYPDTKEGVKQWRKDVAAKMESQANDTVYCSALDADVEIRRAGIRKVISTSGDTRKLQLLPAIKQILSGAKPVGAEKPNYDKANSPNIVGYQTMRIELSLAGERIAVRIVLGRDDKGRYHYDHRIYPIDVTFDSANEKGPAEADPSGLLGGNQGCAHDRSAMPEPARLLPVEPSTEQQVNPIMGEGLESVNSEQTKATMDDASGPTMTRPTAAAWC